MNLHLPNADVTLDSDFLSREEADSLFATLSRDIDWRQEDVVIQGRRIPQPRLTAWFGRGYTYSGLTMTPMPWLPSLEALRKRLSEHCGQEFNSVLANRYRSNRDSIGFHSDNERELGPDPVIASISLGRSRDFILAPKRGREGRRTVVRLEHGSLLLMGRGTQPNWMHEIEKEGTPSNKERINLTFRTINP